MNLKIIDNFHPRKELTSYLRANISSLTKDIAEQTAHLALRGKINALAWIYKTALVNLYIIPIFIWTVFRSVTKKLTHLKN